MSYGTDRAKSMKQDYLSLRKAEGLREESLRHMGHAVNRLFRFCEAKDLEPDELQKKHYTEWVNELRDSVSEATVTTTSCRCERSSAGWRPGALREAALTLKQSLT